MTDPTDSAEVRALNREDLWTLVDAVLGGNRYKPHREAAERVRRVLAAAPREAKTDDAGASEGLRAALALMVEHHDAHDPLIDDNHECAEAAYARAALAKTPEAAAPRSEIAWLIERGQPEKQMPTVWWKDRKRWGLTHMDDWTTDAFEAFRFESKEAAEEFIGRKFTPPVGEPSARAVEHGFVGEAAAPRSGEGLDVERLTAAIHLVENHVHDGSTGLHRNGNEHPFGETQRKKAAEIAAEYIRLRENTDAE